MNDEPESPRQSSYYSAVLAILVALPLLYALSIGPAAYCLSKFNVGRSTEDMVEAFYAPIIWLADHTSMEKPIDSYIEWWEWLARRR
ncbi:hypothetical protein [Prosthecobacter sp.]|uniref:hypothetical protein n=1 Tax=Prosthecobacter sp. TaxID=1965333 RepID=UPI0037833E78